MVASGRGSWDSVRQSFADQFEQDGSGFVYRRSQKGEAFRVSAEERTKFIEDFDRDLRRAQWMIYIGIGLAVAGVVLFTIVSHSNFPQVAGVVAMIFGMVPYLIYFRRAWAAPARALAGRTPIARELSRDEVHELKFRKITYGNLAAAAFGGVVIAFAGSKSLDFHSVSTWLWAVPGVGLVLFAAVQAFRKWQFDEANAGRAPIMAPLQPAFATDIGQTTDEESKPPVWRYAPLAVIVLGIGFIAYTAAGKRLAQQAFFWPALIAAIGAWALFSVVQGYRKGRVTPFVRGYADSYERETQPKRYWASMAWNGLLGCGMLWLSLTPLLDMRSDRTVTHCVDEDDQFSLKDSFDACSSLIAGQVRSRHFDAADAYVYRGYDDDRLGARDRAVADYTQAIRLRPENGEVYGRRGLIYLNSGKFNVAVADFSRALELDPKDRWSLANRGLAYALMRQTSLAEADFQAVEAIDKSNPVMLRGRAVLSINALNMADAVTYLTASMKRDPDNLWAVRTRAWAYRQLGDDEHADADIARYEKLSGRPAFVTVPPQKS